MTSGREPLAEEDEGQHAGHHRDEGIEQGGAGCRQVPHGDIGEGVVAADAENAQKDDRLPGRPQDPPLRLEMRQSQRKNAGEGDYPAPIEASPTVAGRRASRGS